MILAHLIYSQIQKKYPDVEFTDLNDGSGIIVEFKKRNGKQEYLICLDFSGDGTALEDVQVFKGEIIETIEHKKII